MILHIEKVLGIDTATIAGLDPGKIVEVIGPNEAGKTSCAVAAQAVFAQDPNPVALPATDTRRAYLHDGDTEAVAALTLSSELEIIWRPANAEIEAPSGTSLGVSLPVSVPEAVGIVDFCARRSARERAALLHATLLPDPAAVLAELESALRERLAREDVAGVLRMVQERGWKPAAAIFTERTRDAKRLWASVTGTTYGIRKAEDWRPDAWQAHFDNLTATEAEADVVTARDALSALHRADAITEHELQEAQDAADQLPHALAELDEFQQALVAVQRDKAEASAVLASKLKRQRELKDAVPPPAQGRPQALQCPKCETPLIQTSSGLEEWNAEKEQARIDDANRENEAGLEALREYAPAVGEARSRACAMEEKYRVAHDQVLGYQARVDGLNAKAALAGGDRMVETEESRQAIARAEQDVEDQKEVVEIVKARENAAQFHDNAVRYGGIAAVLGPAGIRAKMLDSGLLKLNAGLAVLVEETGWPATAVDSGGAISYGGRPAPLCSESAQWRIQAMLQLTLAAITDSGAVVLDRADLLDVDNRKALARALRRVCDKRPIAVLLCSTGTPTEDAPWTQLQIAGGRIEA